MYPQTNKRPPILKKILVDVCRREDQTLIHITTMYITLVLVQAYAVFLLVSR